MLSLNIIGTNIHFVLWLMMNNNNYTFGEIS